MYFNILLGIHIFLCVCLVGLILLQEGKEIGATLGGGGANASSIFGAAGIDKPIVRATTFVAVLFMLSSIMLVNAYSRTPSTVAVSESPILQKLNVGIEPEGAAETAPAVDPSASNDAPAVGDLKGE